MPVTNFKPRVRHLISASDYARITKFLNTVFYTRDMSIHTKIDIVLLLIGTTILTSVIIAAHL